MGIRTRTVQAGALLPLMVEPDNGGPLSLDDLVDLIQDRHEWLEQQLLVHGGVLFRGYPVASADEFQKVALTVTPALKPYIEGQSPRTKVETSGNGNVYTSTEYPPQYPITLHSKLSYAKTPPNRILFYCHIQPQTGGETPIADEELNRVRDVLRQQSVIFPWQQRDVLVLENHLVAHGRMPYEGPRKILVAMN